jgi:membrane protease YdiL (CAAX protease family)
MMDKERLILLRREMNQPGIVLIIYQMLMAVCYTASLTVDAVIYIIVESSQIGIDAAMYLLTDHILEATAANAWGYLLTCVMGGVILLVWKKKEFCFQEIWKRGAPMKPVDFLLILVVFLSGQLVFQVMASAMEAVLNLFGMSMMESIESATIQTDSISMFLYAGLFAPVFEEILFRGLLLRTLLPYGKKFAIVITAILFGVFHGNLAQTSFAFCVGLILGYVALEYNIGWAMVLHMFNNLILGDVYSRLLNLLPENLGGLIDGIVMILLGIAAVIILVIRRREIAAYCKAEKLDDLHLRAFFTAPANLIFILYISAMMVATIVLSTI